VGAADHDVIENTGRRRRRWPLLAVVIVIAAALAARFADDQRGIVGILVTGARVQ